MVVIHGVGNLGGGAMATAIKEFWSSGSDPSELESALSSNATSIKLKSSKGGLNYSCNFVTSNSFSLSKCTYKGSISFSRHGSADKALIFFAEKGRAAFSGKSFEAVSVGHQAAICDGRTEFAVEVESERKHLVLTVCQKELRSRLSRLLEKEVADSFALPSQIDDRIGAGKLLKSLSTMVFETPNVASALGQAPLALTSFTETFYSVLLATMPHNYAEELLKPALQATPKHVTWAADYMRANSNKVLTIENIADACGVSARTLQLSFRQYMDTTPMAYLRDLRMRKVHEALKAASPGMTVAEVCRSYGFIHLGRFAADYQRVFGELPSATLKM